jgi:hypothetical protein
MRLPRSTCQAEQHLLEIVAPGNRAAHIACRDGNGVNGAGNEIDRGRPKFHCSHLSPKQAAIVPYIKATQTRYPERTPSIPDAVGAGQGDHRYACGERAPSTPPRHA